MTGVTTRSPAENENDVRIGTLQSFVDDQHQVRAYFSEAFGRQEQTDAPLATRPVDSPPAHHVVEVPGVTGPGTSPRHILGADVSFGPVVLANPNLVVRR